MKDDTAIEPNLTVNLTGRYYAMLSVLPYLLLGILAFFTAAFVAILLLVRNPSASFEIVLMPFLVGSAVAVPFLTAFMFMIRWHGKRRLELDQEGITLVLPGERQVYVPYAFLLAVELRFTLPKLVVCTLVSGALRFSFTTLELNLSERASIKKVFLEGFALEKMREFLYHLHKRNSTLAWRITPEFKKQFNVSYPPYDLEKMKYGA